MMVWLALDDGACTIDLFGEDEAYHLMGEGHARKGYFLVAAVVHFFRESVRTSDDKDETTGGILLLL